LLREGLREDLKSPRMLSVHARRPLFPRESGPARRKISVNQLAIADVDNPHRAQLVDNLGLLPGLLLKKENHRLCR
jgi:hypothetical protein